MDIFDFAMKMELDGKKYYETKAAETKEKSLKEILLTLAEEELNHFNFFKKMKDGEIEQAAAQINTKTDTLNKIQNIFIDLSKNNDKKSFGEDDISVWTEALKIEEKAESFYRGKAVSEPDKAKSKLLNLIADEERNHVHMIEGVLSYLKFPDAFAQSAQFQNFQSLEGH